MRRLGALILLVGLACPAWSADPPVEQSSVPWYRWLFLGERAKPVAAKPPTRIAGERPGLEPKEQMARSLDQERSTYLQRLQAISEIRRIAVERGDEAMVRKADDLERQADEVFRDRSSRMQQSDRTSLEKGRDDGSRSADASKRRPTRGSDR